MLYTKSFECIISIVYLTNVIADEERTIRKITHEKRK